MSLRWVQHHKDPSGERTVRVYCNSLRRRLLRNLQPGAGPEADGEDQSPRRSPVHSSEQPGRAEQHADGGQDSSGPPQPTSQRLRRSQAAVAAR